MLLLLLGEFSALWGERERVVRCIIVFHSTTFSHLHTSHINNSLIPRSSPPPTVACKTTGEGTPREEAVYRYQTLVFVKQYKLGMC